MGSVPWPMKSLFIGVASLVGGIGRDTLNATDGERKGPNVKGNRGTNSVEYSSKLNGNLREKNTI